MFKSLKSRGLLSGLSIIIGMLLVAMYGQNLLRTSQLTNQLHTEKLISLNHQLIQIKNPLVGIETTLFQFLLSLERLDIAPVEQHIAELKQQVVLFQQHPLLQQDPDARKHVDIIILRHRILTQKVEDILNFTNQQRFPTMRLLFERINPLVEIFDHHIQVIENLLDDPDSELPIERTRNLINRLKYTWSQSVSNTRLMISSRTGIFGNPLAAQKVMRKDADAYHSLLNSLLSQLVVIQINVSDTTFSESLNQLLSAHQSRLNALNLLQTGLASKDWRIDRHLMLTQIKPMIDQMNMEIAALESYEASLSKQNLSRMQYASEQLSNFLWLGVFMLITLILLTYLVFEFLIRKPMENVALAMQLESEEVTYKPLKRIGAREIDDLIIAFEQMQKQIRWRQEKLSEKVTQLDSSLHQLRQTQKQLVESEKMASLAGLVAGVAHEINTPIGVSVTASSHLQSELKIVQNKYTDGSLGAEDLEDYIQDANAATGIILSNLQRAAALIKSFKQVAVDQSSAEIRTLNLKEYMDEIILNLHPRLKKTSHQVIVLIADDINLTTVPGALAQIMTNLIMNSLLHAFEKDVAGEITISAVINGSNAELTYHDNGKGIIKEDKNKIFEPFFTTKRGAGGSGLGMHITYNLVTSTLKGKIACTSEPDHGAEFVMVFPAHIEPDQSKLALD